MLDRKLEWDGCKNTRDLGGLRRVHGGTTQFGAVVRSDSPARLMPKGWAALYEFGVRTIVTLHTANYEERELDVASPYPDVNVVRVAIEDFSDTEFVERWGKTDYLCTPLYYKDALRRWPGRHAAAISAVGRAGAGAVLIHCGRGYDRTGIVSLLLQALVDATVDDMIADYEMSRDPKRDILLARAQTSVREAICAALEGLAIDDFLLRGGARSSDLSAVRRRLLG